jgi:hypothetical protein
MSEETVTFNLELNVEYVMSNLRRLELLLYRSLALASRLGLPENIDVAINKIQRMVMVIRLLHTSMIALEAASGPIGIALAAVGLVSFGVTTGDLVYDLTRGT